MSAESTLSLSQYSQADFAVTFSIFDSIPLLLCTYPPCGQGNLCFLESMAKEDHNHKLQVPIEEDSFSALESIFTLVFLKALYTPVLYIIFHYAFFILLLRSNHLQGRVKNILYVKSPVHVRLRIPIV